MTEEEYQELKDVKWECTLTDISEVELERLNIQADIARQLTRIADYYEDIHDNLKGKRKVGLAD